LQQSRWSLTHHFSWFLAFAGASLETNRAEEQIEEEADHWGPGELRILGFREDAFPDPEAWQNLLAFF